MRSRRRSQKFGETKPRRSKPKTLEERQQISKSKDEQSKMHKIEQTKQREIEQKIQLEDEQKIRETRDTQLQAIWQEPPLVETQRTIPPIKCKSCGTLIADKYDLYTDLIQGGFSSIDAFIRTKDHTINFLMKKLSANSISSVTITEELSFISDEKRIKEYRESVLFYLGDISDISGNIHLLKRRYMEWLYSLYLMMRKTKLANEYIFKIIGLTEEQIYRIDPQENVMFSLVNINMTKKQMEKYNIIKKHQAKTPLSNKDIFNLLGLSDHLNLYEDLTTELRDVDAFYVALLGWEGYKLFKRMTKRGMQDDESFSPGFRKKEKDVKEMSTVDARAILSIFERNKAKDTSSDESSIGETTKEYYTFRKLISSESSRGLSVSETFQIMEISNDKCKAYKMKVNQQGLSPKEAFSSLGLSHLYSEFSKTVGKAMKTSEALMALGMYSYFYDVFQTFRKGYTIGQNAFIALGGNEKWYNMYLAVKHENGTTKENAMNMLGLIKFCCRGALDNPIVMPAGVLFKGSVGTKLPLKVLAPHETIEAYELGVHVDMNVFRDRTKNRSGVRINHIGLKTQEILLPLHIQAQRDKLASQMESNIQHVRAGADENKYVERYFDPELSDGSLDGDHGVSAGLVSEDDDEEENFGEEEEEEEEFNMDD